MYGHAGTRREGQSKLLKFQIPSKPIQELFLDLGLYRCQVGQTGKEQGEGKKEYKKDTYR